ncbi:hypothetical protein VC83_01073 [Pseudogymnoascus destructans]|uniref:Uncharacterized protein n=3 Tax=Pseudogymnoascus TaxID=78156 RepID=A0A1B8GSL4_9PEZI|nr:uncharacterized protein VE01_03364 [Pseudogymnoascus verrucosus]XP_024327536.1 uncharacterized protein VC83_01073 [Pseudogymnoascus destructans]ELR07821.1 hypothetical protein GMDG_00442 [Pseudogymnoascus destructans 20631-21]OBT51879.1 hypothetical protein VE04_07337 [Pseudogymnoascus sp. 24MN13]OBT76659.1 hypothetical protein VF21_05297 [Pseudogymnoascus sp. 05NY08]OAF62263.1 hypothetical protein VC83_01073 [Pseudogymnoascus destructans]OBT98818.1 hypothetical protein VE01_03364 [Pseudog
MKPVVSIMHAWSCIVISVFAIVILSVLGALFNANHHSLMDSNDDPEDGTVVAGTAFAAVGVYGFFLVFCGLQAWLHARESRRGAIAL